MTSLRKPKKLANKIIFSNYLRKIRRGNITAIFHELLPAPVFLKNTIAEDFFSSPLKHPGVIKELIASGLILNDKKDDAVVLERFQTKLNDKLHKTFILYLVLTKDCNFHCAYCPFKKDANDDKAIYMDKNTLKRGVDIWAKNITENYSKDVNYFVIFYGGEPLLNLETLKFGLSYIDKLKKEKRLPLNVNFLVPTNGSLINDEVINIFKKYKVLASIGIDDINTKHKNFRIDGDKNNSLDNSIAIARKLIKNGIETSASVTITPQNIKRLSEISTSFKKLGIKKIGFNFLKADGLRCLVKDKRIEKYYNQAADAVIKNFSGQKEGENFEFQMEKKLLSFSKKDFPPIDCTCYGNQLVILPNGNITNCPFNGEKLADVKNVNNKFNIHNTDKVKLLKGRFPVFNKGKGFYWQSLYGGGCSWNSKIIWKNELGIDKGASIFAKKVFDFLLWSNLTKNKNEKS